MNCADVRELLSPYLDSDLDGRTTFIIARHLEGCPECAGRFQREEALERAVASRLRAARGDEAAIFARALDRALAPRRPRRRRRLLAAAAALLLAAGAGLGFRALLAPPAGDAPGAAIPDLVAAAAADHAKFARGEMGPQIRAHEARALSRYLSETLRSEVRWRPPPGEWVVEGARLCHLRSARVGLVLLRNGNRSVSVFVVPSREAVRFPATRAAARDRPSYRVPGGHGVVAVAADGTLRCAVGDVDPERLAGLLASAG